MPKQVTIDTALAEVAVAIDHLASGIRMLNTISQQQPLPADQVEKIRALESEMNAWLITMEDLYMEEA